MVFKLLFFSKHCKKSPSGLGLRPRPPCVLRLRYTSSLNTSPNLDICTFVLSPLFIAKSWLRAKTQAQLLIFQSTISLSYKKFLFRKFLMTSLHVSCSLAPPPFKNPGYGYVWNTLYNKYIFVSDYRNCFGNFEHSLWNFAFVVRSKHC